MWDLRVRDKDKLAKIVSENPGISLNELVRKVKWSKLTVRKKLDELIKEGVIYEEKPKRPGQRTRLYPTELLNLYEILKEAFEKLKEIIDSYTSVLDYKIKKGEIKVDERFTLLKNLYDFISTHIHTLITTAFNFRMPREVEERIMVHALDVLKYYFIKVYGELKEIRYPPEEEHIFIYDLKEMLCDNIRREYFFTYLRRDEKAETTEVIEKMFGDVDDKTLSEIYEKVLIESIPDYDRDQKKVEYVIAEDDCSVVTFFGKPLALKSPDRLNLCIDLHWIEFYSKLLKFLEEKLKRCEQK